MITVIDVAKAAGVSIATVSRVTNGRGNVKRETELRVLDAISRLHYQPDTMAVELRRKRGKDQGRCLENDMLRSAEAGAGGRAWSNQIGRRSLRFLERENSRLRNRVASLRQEASKWKK